MSAEIIEKQRLGFIGLGEDTASACLSMLRIVDGRSGTSWSHSSPEQADVLMTSYEVFQQGLDDKKSDKPCIVVYPSNQQKPSTRFSLQHPFRVMQLLSVLEEVAATLQPSQRSNQASTSTLTSLASANDGEQTVSPFWQSLHQAIKGPLKSSEILVSETPHGPLYFKPAAQRFYANKVLLKKLTASSLELTQLVPWRGALPDGLTTCPLFSLCWLVSRDSANRLASWISEHGTFQLKRWPNFGSLEKNRIYLSLSALMMKQPLTRQQLQQAAQCTEENIDRFINACEMSGLLVFQEAANASVNVAVSNQSKGRFGGLIKGLRSRLGLGV